MIRADGDHQPGWEAVRELETIGRVLGLARVRLLRERGDTCVLWDCVPRDWVDEHAWLPRALAHIDATDWSVVVDTYPRSVYVLPFNAAFSMRRYSFCVMPR